MISATLVDAVAVRATTGILGPTKDLISPKHPYIGLYAGDFDFSAVLPLQIKTIFSNEHLLLSDHFKPLNLKKIVSN